jgi:flagellar biogenesis protein FliO
MLFGFIDTGALAKTVAAAFVSGVGIILIFSIALYGVARFAEMSREGRSTSAVAYGSLAVLAGLAFAAAIVVGIIVMTAK